MSSPINPVVSGIMQGFQLAHAIKGERLNQQALEQQKARDDENTQVRDLQTRMSLSDRGYKPITPDQEAEAATGQAIAPTAIPGGAGSMVPGTTIDAPQKSDIKTRMATYKGDKYVRDSDAVLRARARDTAKQTTADKLDYEGQLADVKRRAKSKGLEDQKNLLGLPLTDETSDKIGVKHGGSLMQGPGFSGEIGGVARAIAPPKPVAKKTPKAFLTREGGGNVTQVDEDGNVKISQPLGLPEPAKKGAAGGITAYQQNRIDRQKKVDEDKAAADHVKAQDAAQKQIDALNKREQVFHEQNRQLGARALALGKGTATDKKGKPYKPDAAARDAELEQIKERIGSNQGQVKALQDEQHRVTMRFAAPKAAAAPAVDPQQQAAPATGATGAPKQTAPVKHYKGEKQSYGGRDYVYDGSQWAGQ